MSAEPEMTLEEWCNRLYPSHRVHRDLAELRAKAKELEILRELNTQEMIEKGESTFCGLPLGEAADIVQAELHRRWLNKEGKHVQD